MAVVWKAMVPPGSRATPVQLASRAAGSTETTTHENASSPTCWPRENSWSCATISSPSANGEFGLRTLFAWTNSNGLNTTLKTSVCDLAGPGPDACEVAANDTAPARPSTTAAAAPARGTFRMAPPPAARAGLCAVRLLSGQPLPTLGAPHQAVHELLHPRRLACDTAAQARPLTFSPITCPRSRPRDVPALSDQLATVAVTTGEHLRSDGAERSTYADSGPVG